MATLFFSYSHRDEALRDQLETHLTMLKRQGFIETWHDRRITAGEPLDRAISANLESADIVLLLVSPDFLASDYCYEREMLRAVERHKARACTVIPVILRPCDWHDAPFGGLLAAPKDGKPITQWPDIDAAFLDVTTAIKGAVRKRGPTPTGNPANPAPSRTPPSGAPAPMAARSSNLRVAKRFTQHDKEVFLQDAFEFIAKYFENSLHELAARNPGIEGRFRRIDANRFSAVAYREGDALARCSISLSGGSGFTSGITYSHNDSASTTSFNESLSVENDDQAIYLKAMGMSSFGRGPDEKTKLTPEGGAEFYWDMFIEPLQRDQRR
jgi:TIR domain